jgi:hypothetical protein
LVEHQKKGGEKNMNKLLIFSAITLGTATVLLTAVPKVLAYRGDPTVHGPNYTEERHDAMTKAFENKDYQAWKDQMQGRGRVSQVVDEQNFARFAEMHQLMLDGKTDEANKIRTELGLGLQNGSGRGQGMGYGRNGNR